MSGGKRSGGAASESRFSFRLMKFILISSAARWAISGNDQAAYRNGYHSRLFTTRLNNERGIGTGPSLGHFSDSGRISIGYRDWNRPAKTSFFNEVMLSYCQRFRLPHC